MLSPFVFDSLFNTNFNRRNNRRLRGFIPIWDEFNLAHGVLNDPFFNHRNHEDNINMMIENKEEEKATQVTKGKQSSNKNEEKQLVDTKNTKNSSKGLLSLWNDNKTWKGLNEEIKLDIDEKEDKYVVSAKLNGFNKEDLKLQVKDGLLTVSGEMKEEKKR